MAQCVYVDTAASGVLMAAPDPCTSLVLLTPAEYAHLSSSPFLLTVEQGTEMAGLIALVWISAFLLRALHSMFRSRNDVDE